MSKPLLQPDGLDRNHIGVGSIILTTHGSEASFSELSSTYPLKLLSPRIARDNVAIAYILSYGGGLVGGDRIELSVEVRDGASLVLLSQGSTKVFKTRPGTRLSARSQELANTTQKMDVIISSDSALFLLPDPVTCFRSAKYNQLQTFRLQRDASAVLLDWITSGRKSLGEEWAFSRYYSLNEVWVEGERIARDVLLLEDHDLHINSLPPRTLSNSLAPYSCYATVIMYGPLVQSTIRHLATEYASISVFKRHSPPGLLWSLSMIREGRGCVVRVAAKESEDVKTWLSGSLRELEPSNGVKQLLEVYVAQDAPNT
ncbi:Urease accessory protein D [Grifola frondosa]|uniref:Urease accessory protein D n=1 Tax=Grifola frondosa TaxID=5627 RepID=A0A1C7MUS0_GRIFR|nr:Urease accessory protein D [Grifola frondosa]